MTKIEINYKGLSNIPPFNYGVLKTEIIEKTTLDKAITYLYKINNGNTENIYFDKDNKLFTTSILLGKTDFGSVVTAYYTVKVE